MVSESQLQSRRAPNISEQSSNVNSMNGAPVGHHRETTNHTENKRKRLHALDDDKEDSSSSSTAVAVAYTFLPTWLSTITMLSLIFGGCCANVFALEAIIKTAPQSGTLITASQFLLTSLFTLSSNIDLSRGLRNLYLRPRAIPLRRWLLYTLLFLTINILNNAAFSYKISVPLHIILRSAGPVATMGVGYFYGRRYTRIQIIAVFLLFLGVVQAAIADAQTKGAQISLFSSAPSKGPGRTSSEFWTGFSILYLALMLSAIMGVFTDRTYARYGRDHTYENLFYSHTLSLPFFLMRWPELQAQASALFISAPISSYIALPSTETPWSWSHSLLSRVPIQPVFLLLNACTQYLCISGVNQLSARSSSLTVGIVLNIRKLVSLLLSIWLFGNKLSPGVLVGAATVFLGGALYALPTTTKPKDEKSLDKGKRGGKKEL